MIPLNYHHLYYFWSAVKAGSITRASRNLMLSQPALSLQLRQLEKSLGAPLLRRQRSGVTLTPRGRLVFERCERIFAEGEALAREVKRGSPEPPALRVGVAQTVSREPALRLVEAVASAGVRPVLLSSSRVELRERLSRHSLDAALSDADFSQDLGPDFRAVLVARLAVRLVAAPALARKLRGFLEGRVEFPMLLRAPESPVRVALEGLLAARGARYQVAAETNDASLLLHLALRGRGVAALSAPVADADLRARRLVAVDGGRALLRERVWLILPAQPPPEPAVRQAVQLLARGF